MPSSSILSTQEIAVLERAVPADVKERLLAIARSRFAIIFPVGFETTIEGGFRYELNQYAFWFNDANEGTHRVHENIESKSHLQEA